MTLGSNQGIESLGLTELARAYEAELAKPHGDEAVYLEPFIAKVNRYADSAATPESPGGLSPRGRAMVAQRIFENATDTAAFFMPEDFTSGSVSKSVEAEPQLDEKTDQGAEPEASVNAHPEISTEEAEAEAHRIPLDPELIAEQGLETEDFEDEAPFKLGQKIYFVTGEEVVVCDDKYYVVEGHKCILVDASTTSIEEFKARPVMAPVEDVKVWQHVYAEALQEDDGTSSSVNLGVVYDFDAEENDEADDGVDEELPVLDLESEEIIAGQEGISNVEAKEVRPLQLTVAAKTEAGKGKSVNEDAIFWSNPEDPLNLFVVCDGMGGHLGGAVASQTVRDTLADYFRRNQEWINPDNAVREMRDAYYLAMANLQEKVEADHSLKQMGTTASSLHFSTDAEGNHWAAIGHVGDSRIYRRDVDSTITLLTEDETLAERDKIDSAKAGSVLYNAMQASGADLVQFKQIQVKPGQRFMVCSDGVTGDTEAQAFTPEELEDALGTPDPEMASRKLILKSREPGKKYYDDKSVIVIDVA